MTLNVKFKKKKTKKKKNPPQPKHQPLNKKTPGTQKKNQKKYTTKSTKI